jgi:beta-N-acetylhexosaminidase
MVGHIDVRAVDPGVPSSLSRELVTGKLRGELGFPGLVTTDALNMQAVADRYSSAQVAVRALRAGVDVLLMPTSPEAARDGIVAAVRQGRLSAKRLNQAATRHVALLLHQRAEGTTTKPPGSSAGVAARWSAQAITSVAGRCRGRLVGDQVAVTGPATAVGHFRRAAEDAGLAVGASGTTVRLVGYGGAGTSGDVVVALDAPHVLGRSSAPVKLATYGETRGAMRALVAVLTGRAEAPGELPVGVAGVPRRGC